MASIIGISALLLLAGETFAFPAESPPPGDGLATASITSESVNHSQFTWISSWATTTTGTDQITYSPYLEQQSQSDSSTGSDSSSSNNSSNGVSRIVIPVVVALLVALACMGGILLVRWRRQRALRAHRRKSSWMASNRFKWHGDVKAPFDDTPHEPEGSPPFTTLPAPQRVTTHERKTSII